MINFDENNNIVDDKINRAFLVGVSLGSDISYYMEELERLAEASSCVVVASAVQNLEKINKATYIGKGKLEEIAEFCKNNDVDVVIFNDELTGVQIRNIEEKLEVRVIDRTILILDIFASRARNKEGKLQVELAQLEYRKTRLVGFGKSLSRLGGGIGTRGPGEKKLETDRRHLERRIFELKDELKKIERVADLKREKRENSNIPIVALVGYTNAGKSALMNAIHGKFLLESESVDASESEVFSKDMLFATLDTKNKLIKAEKGKEFVLIDTVGFVSKLPHDLVKAFKSTLDELKYASLLVHVVDNSSPDKDFQVEVVERVLCELGVSDKETIVAYNKIDKNVKYINNNIYFDLKQEDYKTDLQLEKENVFVDTDLNSDSNSAYISATKDINIEALINQVLDKVYRGNIKARLKIPYSKGDIASYALDNGMNTTVTYVEEGSVVEGEFAADVYGRLREYDTL